MNTKLILLSIAGGLSLALAACGPAATPSSAPMSTAAATMAPMATQAAEAAAPTSSGSLAALVPPAANRMVIKDATLTLEVTSLASSMSAISQMAADQGGYVLESSTNGFDDRQTASLRLAVPADKFEATLERLRQLSSRVVSEQASGQDVSADYVDLQTRLTNLEATSARVREFLAEAKTVEESLNVNAELSRLEGEIAQIKGQMTYYEGRSAYSTIGLSLTQVGADPTPEPTAVWDPGKALSRATDNAGRLSQGLYDAFVYIVIGFAPLWAPGLIFVLGLVWLGRRGTRQKNVERKA